MPKNRKKDALIVQLLLDEATANQGFKLLIDTYSQRLYWHIRSIVKNHHDANDVVQNTFIKVFKGIKGFNEQAKLYTWLYRIATNESLTFLKRKKIVEPMEGKLLHQKASAYHDEEQTVQNLKNAIDLLPEKQRLVFSLRYFEAMPYKDIAEITGTSEGALKASYHLAVKKLQTILTKNNIH